MAGSLLINPGTVRKRRISSPNNFPVKDCFVENNDSFEIDLAVPGMKKDDFTIELNDKILVISSDNSNYDQNERTRLNEFNYSSFQRSFRVPESVELDKIKANYKNGILKIKLPKRKDSITKPNRVIDIS